MKYLKIFFLFLLSVLFIIKSKAQLFDEWEARPNIALKYKFNKQWSVTGTYYHYLENNFKQYNKSVMSVDAGFKINSWLKAGIDYRYGFNSRKHYHDIRYSIAFDFKLSPRWKVAYRPMMQQEFVSLKKEHLVKNPIEYFLRNRLTFSYDATSNLELYVFTENYLEIEEGNMGFYRQKSALGSDYKLNGRNKIGFRFEVINKKNGKMVARPNLSYTYSLGYGKKIN